MSLVGPQVTGREGPESLLLLQVLPFFSHGKRRAAPPGSLWSSRRNDAFLGYQTDPGKVTGQIRWEGRDPDASYKWTWECFYLCLEALVTLPQALAGGH